MTLPELIAALEAADGPSWELDAAIMDGTTKPGRSFNHYCHLLPRGTDRTRAWKDYCEERAKRYTFSIDAALSLVPEGVPVSMSTQEPGPWACVGDGVANMASTLPLALCIAALRARSSGG